MRDARSGAKVDAAAGLVRHGTCRFLSPARVARGLHVTDRPHARVDPPCVQSSASRVRWLRPGSAWQAWCGRRTAGDSSCAAARVGWGTRDRRALLVRGVQQLSAGGHLAGFARPDPADRGRGRHRARGARRLLGSARVARSVRSAGVRGTTGRVRLVQLPDKRTRTRPEIVLDGSSTLQNGGRGAGCAGPASLGEVSPASARQT